MSKIIIQMLITVLVTAISIVAVKRNEFLKNEKVSQKIKTVFNSTKKEKIYFCVMILFNIVLNYVFIEIYTENSIFFNMKRIALVSILWIVAYYDYKSYRIPNKAILLGLAYRGVILLFEVIFYRENLLQTVISEVIASVALIIISVLCMLIVKNAIGMGDVKLFIVIGVSLGLSGIMTAVGASLIVSFVIAVALLLTKKKSRKDSIPFAPSILLGTLFAVIALGA